MRLSREDRFDCSLCGTWTCGSCGNSTSQVNLYYRRSEVCVKCRKRSGRINPSRHIKWDLARDHYLEGASVFQGLPVEQALDRISGQIQKMDRVDVSENSLKTKEYISSVRKRYSWKSKRLGWDARAQEAAVESEDGWDYRATCGFVDGAKWQREQLLSEESVEEMAKVFSGQVQGWDDLRMTVKEAWRVKTKSILKSVLEKSS